MTIKDKEARNRYNREYYQKHKDQLREYHRVKEKEYYHKRRSDLIEKNFDK